MRYNKNTESTECIHRSKNKERPSGGKPKDVVLIKLFGEDTESLKEIHQEEKNNEIKCDTPTLVLTYTYLSPPLTLT